MDKNITYIIAILAIVSLVVAAYGFIVFQGQISDLETSNASLETSLSGIQGSLSTIQGQIDEYQQTIVEQQQSLSTIQEQIEDYQQTIEEQQEQISEYQEITLVDGVGNVVTLNEPPERIVSLAPSNTEILFLLGAGDKVVGVTDYCDYPYNFTAWVEAGNMSSIGSYYGPSIEPIVALEPDLILASTGSLDAAASLTKLGYNVLVTEGQYIDEILSDIIMVGRATYQNTEASDIVSEMRTRIDAVVNQVATATTLKVYHEVWYDPIMSIGPTTFIDEIIGLAGGENIFHDATTSWPTVSLEAIVERNPDVMFFPDMYMSTVNFYETIEAVKERPGWTSITAVKNDAIYEINADIISRTGPRLVDALEAIAKMVHPEIFGQP
ncbi:cobalamin-binding protein [Candidatus Bathyarchaeota archaeon]|nr:cobalamin-binding protein [Candidatus Bathyarchaeota archaeon]